MRKALRLETLKSVLETIPKCTDLDQLKKLLELEFMNIEADR